MPYYPILQSPYCTGKTTLYNFTPNDWEVADRSKKFINLTYSDGERWCSKVLGELDYGSFKEFTHASTIDLIPNGELPLLSLTMDELPEFSNTLPFLRQKSTITPLDRATLSLESKYMTTNYQGEIEPFPSQASLLTFAPLIQFGANIENYILLVNLEKDPKRREVEVELYDSLTGILKSVEGAYSNQINIISLDNIGFDENILPVIVCKGMSGIPLYFSSYKQGQLLSLEHTHPPASLVVLGSRPSVQTRLKTYWFDRLKR